MKYIKSSDLYATPKFALKLELLVFYNELDIRNGNLDLNYNFSYFWHLETPYGYNRRKRACCIFGETLDFLSYRDNIFRLINQNYDFSCNLLNIFGPNDQSKHTPSKSYLFGFLQTLF